MLDRTPKASQSRQKRQIFGVEKNIYHKGTGLVLKLMDSETFLKIRIQQLLISEDSVALKFFPCFFSIDRFEDV